MSRLVSTGSVIVDLPLAMPHLPERGGDVLGSAEAPTPGGGFNVVAAAARQGARVSLLSPLGDGPQGRLCADALGAEGVHLLLDPVPGIDTGLCVTVTEPDGERTFLTAAGAEATLTAAQLTVSLPEPGDVVYVSGYDLAYASGGVLGAWAAALPGSVRLVLDPGPLVGDLPTELLAAVAGRADVLTLNERESVILGGQPGVLALAGPGAVVLLRSGPDGCLVVTPDDDAPGGRTRTPVPAPVVTVVDSTGAGDAHAGTLIAEMLRDTPILEAVRRANAAAAITVTRAGPATSPARSELDAFLAGA